MPFAIALVAAARGTWSPCGLSMVSAINPMSERARGKRYGITVCWFVLGALLGGLALGSLGAAIASLVGWLPVSPTVALAIAAICCLLGTLSDSDSAPLRLPDHPRQVNERWLTDYRRWLYAAGFGLQIGFGLATYIMTAAVFLVPVLGALSGSPLQALLLGAVFGVVRGASVLLTARVRDSAMLFALHRGLEHWANGSKYVALWIQAVGAIAFSAGAFGLPGVAAMVLPLTLLFYVARRRLQSSTRDLRRPVDSMR